MDKFFKNKDAVYFKNIFIYNTDIYLSEKDLGEENFLEKFKTAKKGFVESRLKIPIERITEFVLNENESLIMLKFPKIDDDVNAIMQFSSKDEYNEVKEYLISKTNFTGVKEYVGNRVWIKSALYTLASAIATAVCYVAASSGDEITPRGRRKGLQKLLAFLSENLGTTGVLIIGGVITLGLALWTYTKLQQKGTEVEVFR